MIDDRPGYVAIPGRIISTGGRAERDTARLLDLAERHYRAAGTATTQEAWCCATAAGNALLLAVAIVAAIPEHLAQDLYQLRTGAPPWLHHRPDRWTATTDDIPGDWRLEQLELVR